MRANQEVARRRYETAMGRQLIAVHRGPVPARPRFPGNPPTPQRPHQPLRQPIIRSLQQEGKQGELFAIREPPISPELRATSSHGEAGFDLSDFRPMEF